MTTETNNFYLQKIIELMDDMIRAERYGAVNASLANSYAFSIVAQCQDVLDRQAQLDVLAEQGIKPDNIRYRRLADWLMDIEARVAREAELYVWFKDVAINEGLNEFVTTDAKTITDRMCKPQPTPAQELERNARLLGLSLVEAKRIVETNAQEKAAQIEAIAPELCHMAQMYLNCVPSSISELNAFETRRIASMIERKAEAYTERLQTIVLTRPARTRRQMENRQSDIGSIKILEKVVENAGKLADRAEKDIEAGIKAEGETEYDSDHGTTQKLA